MNRNPKILVFDSGVGGLSIVDALQHYAFAEINNHISLDITFVSDNRYFPYGIKTDQQLNDRVLTLFNQLIPQLQPDVVIIACNSASTIVLPSLRKHFDLPIIGVVPAIKPAAQLSKNKSIALLATPATVQRSYTAKLISDFASDCQIVKIGSSELVTIAEQKLRNQTIDMAELEVIIGPIFCQSTAVDTVVLACTHFPLLMDELQSIEKNRAQSNSRQTSIIWIDSSVAIARRLEQILLPKYRDDRWFADVGISKNRVILTSSDQATQPLATYNQFGFTSIEVKPW